jgi:hypothetical protein
MCQVADAIVQKHLNHPSDLQGYVNAFHFRNDSFIVVFSKEPFVSAVTFTYGLCREQCPNMHQNTTFDTTMVNTTKSHLIEKSFSELHTLVIVSIYNVLHAMFVVPSYAEISVGRDYAEILRHAMFSSVK